MNRPERRDRCTAVGRLRAALLPAPRARLLWASPALLAPLLWASPALLAPLWWASPAAAVELVLSRITFVGSEAGEPGIVLEADRARVETDRDVARLEGVRLAAASPDGGTGLRLTCERAVLNLRTSDFTAAGDVRGRTADGHRFETAAAEFHHAARVIESHAPVDIVDPLGTRLEGRGFQYDVRSQRIRMQHAVVIESEEPKE